MNQIGGECRTGNESVSGSASVASVVSVTSDKTSSDRLNSSEPGE